MKMGDQFGLTILLVLLLIFPAHTSASVSLPAGSTYWTTNSYNPDQGYLATASMHVEDATNTSSEFRISIFTKDGEELYHEVNAHNEDITALDWLSADQVVSGSFDDSIKIWSLDSGDLLLEQEFNESGGIYDLKAIDEDTIVYSLTTAKLRMLDLGSGISTEIFDSSGASLSHLAVNTHNILAFSNATTLVLYDLEQGRITYQQGFRSSIIALEWDPSGRYLAICFANALGEKHPQVLDSEDNSSTPIGDENYVSADGISWSPNGKHLLTYTYGEESYQISLWNVSDFQLIDSNHGKGPVTWQGDDSILLYNRESKVYEFLTVEQMFSSVSSSTNNLNYGTMAGVLSLLISTTYMQRRKLQRQSRN